MSTSKTQSTKSAPKIAYLVNCYPSPSLVFVRREIAALERQGHAVARFAIRRWDSPLADPRDLREQEQTCYLLECGIISLLCSMLIVALQRPLKFLAALRLTWKVGGKSDRGRLRNLMYLVEACLLLRRTRAQQIDWIHAHFGTNSTTVAMLCHALGGPKYSFTCHGPEEFDRPEALHLSEKIARASLVVAVSQFGRSQMYRWCEYQHWHKIHVVHCGVDPSYLSLLPSTPPEAPRLVSIGRLHEQKGTLLLVTAAKELVAQGTSLELILVGDGPMRTEVEALIKTFQLEDFVKLVGWQTHDQIQEWLAQSRALVLPSFAEGLPVVIMEALASYRPVITTFIAGIPELVRPGESGWLVPAGDVESLIQAMRAALTAPAEQLAAMGAAGARRVAQRHDVDQQATRLVQRIGAAWRNATPGGVPSASIPLGGRPGQYVPGQNSQVDQLSHDFSHLEQK